MKWTVPIVAACWLATSGALAATEAGKTVFVRGDVTAERAGNETVALARGDLIFERDIIVTGERSRAQFLMKDGAKFDMSEQTRFRVAEYRSAGETVTEADGSVIVSSDDSVAAELIQGAFRTITGAIGRDSPQDYEVQTQAATMGIRGTHYGAVWCQGDCVARAGEPVDDGLYVGVVEGVVYLLNNAGDLLVRAGEHAYVRDRDTAPVLLRDRPPALKDLQPLFRGDDGRAIDELLATLAALEPGAFGIPDDPAGAPPAEFHNRARPAPGERRGEDIGDDEESAGGPLLPPHDSRILGAFNDEPGRAPRTGDGTPIVDGTVPLTRGVAFATAPLATTERFTAVGNRGVRTLDAGGDLAGFSGAFPGQRTDALYAIGGAAVRDDGFDPLTGLRWGRWTGGVATSTLADGSIVPIELGMQSLHYVLGPMTGTGVSVPMGGSANFMLIAGNTDPTDSAGNTGVLGDASLRANFTSQTVTSDITLSIAGLRWTANGTGAISQGLFNGVYNAVEVGGQAGGAGNFSGFFGVAGAGGFPSGAGLTYGLTGPQGVSVSGSVVFGPPVTQ